MNPLKWRREHQVALLCAAGIGFLLGAMFGWHRYYLAERDSRAWADWWTGHVGYMNSSDFTTLLLLPTLWHWLGVAGWAVFGGMLGAAPAYIYRLLHD